MMICKKIFFCVFLLMCLAGKSFAQIPVAKTFSVKDYGAVGDGVTTDNEAINKAIDAASASGGGTVLFPAGTYSSYSIHLKSHISLYLGPGATLLAAPYTAGAKNYDEAEPNEWGDKLKYQDFGHSHFHNSLIWGEHLEDVTICGPGTIYGKGLLRNTPRRVGEGNKAIALKLCRNVTLKDFSILLGGHFGVLATGTDNLTIDNLRMDTNRDGMDIDGCQNVHITNCSVNSPWDDGICLKTSYALGYPRSTENVLISNCQVSGFDRGTFLNGTYMRNESKLVPDHQGPTGRIKLGTESNGAFKGITISNCLFQYCRGLALESVDGGAIEDITIDNLNMRDIVNSPIFLRLGARLRGPTNTLPGSMKRVMISNVNIYNADSHFSSMIAGIPGQKIEDVKLNNIHIYYRPIDSPLVKIQQFVPEHIQDYPEPQRFGVMPAYGFFIRHAAQIEMNNVDITYFGKETRPAVILEDVDQISLNNFKAKVPDGVPAIIQRGTSGFSIINSQGIPGNKIKTEPMPPTVPDPPVNRGQQ